MVIFNDIKMLLQKYFRFDCFIFVKLYLYGIIKKIVDVVDDLSNRLYKEFNFMKKRWWE